MRIELNGSQHDISAATLAEALTELGYGAAALATALNGAFIAAPSRATTPLHDGDRVEVLAPMQGG
ncbi:sulfur carrier protein ThiS [Cypionkella sp. TWP1-2-1b2]|uniref:sulfur carrier protein ThiS n=1 Tax=Cypionkella sp. TWP1-2-1b2 TaxID=2804675 RepID=UPI003CEF2B39